MGMEQKADRQNWSEILEEYRKSGLTQKVFCEQKGIKLSTFCYQKRNLEKKQNPTESTSFVEWKEVEPETLNSNREIQIKLRFGDWCALDLRLG